MRAVHVGVVIGKPQVVHHGVAQHHGVADGQRRGLVVASTLARHQHVLGLQLQRRSPLDAGEHKPDEQRLTLIELEVDFADVLGLVLRAAPTIFEATARVVRLGQVAGQLLRRWAEPRRIDTVTHERSAQVDSPRGVALRRGVGREIAAEHRGGRDKPEEIGRRFAQPGPLIGAKEEQLVGLDRTAECPTVLIPAQPVPSALARRRVDAVEGVRRVEPMIANELEQIAVELICAGLRDHVDRCARVHAVVRCGRTRFQPELL